MYPSLGYRTSQKPSAPSFDEKLAIMSITTENVSTTCEPLTPQAIFKMTKNDTQKPKKFDGENQTAADWLMLFDLAARANEWDTKQRLNKMPSFFEGAAMNWYVNRIMRMGELDGENDEEKLKCLETKLKSAFPSASTHTGALQKMYGRNQHLGENFSHYMADKLSLIHNYNAELAEEDKVAIVLQGCLPTLFEDLYPLQIETLDQLEKQAIVHSEKKNLANTRASVNAITMAPELAQDMALIQARMNNMKTSDRQNNSDNRNFTPRRGNFNRNWRQGAQGNRPWRGTSTRPNGQRPERQLSCWNCQQPGHISNECPNRRVRFNFNGNNRRGDGRYSASTGLNRNGRQGRWGNF